MHVRQQCMKILMASVAALASFTVLADGPAVVAKADHSLWQQAVNTRAGFDKASRASILSYVSVLKEMQKLSDAQMLAAFKINSVNRASVNKWLKKEQAMALANYQAATHDCTKLDWTCLGTPVSLQNLQEKAPQTLEKTPKELLAWRDNLNQFNRAYVSEQLRLAALFPKVTSEIDTFNDLEWNGDAIADRHFYLSFDDGPTIAGGSTDATLAMLSKHRKNAVFFVLGENLGNRLSRSSATDLQNIYKNQCVASHGWQHQSHAKWEQWQDSIQRTQGLLKKTFVSQQVLPYFRPPYGQRKVNSGAFFKAEALQVALWNIDSQDWNAKISSNDISNRMITLMLIKRRGILLFHDVHPKAKEALPLMFAGFADSVIWGDCKQLGDDVNKTNR
jgi:peptidoglycan-N-acetylglucosamine deacetylase